MKWIFKTFQELTTQEFHDISKLRIDVFVVEQNCIYSELDGKDLKAYHLFATNNNESEVIAYARIFKPGHYFQEATFGRVLVHPNYRNNKLGGLLIEKSIAFIQENWPTSSIKISAQTYLKKWYESFGFKQVSDAYLDDGILHIDMLKC